MDAEQRDLLRSLSFIYLVAGREQRALALLLLLDREGADDPATLRALAHTATAAGKPELALTALDRLATRDDAPELALLRSRALHHLGRADEALALFELYAERRGPPESEPDDDDAEAA